MKNVQVIVRPSKVNDEIESLRKSSVGGLTLSTVKGMGRVEPTLVGNSYSMQQIWTVVDDDKVDEIFDKASTINRTSKKEDGKNFVTDVVNAIDLCTKKTCIEAI